MLIVTSEDWEETYWQIERKKMSFGHILEKAKEIEALTRFYKDANWLRKIRNKIGAHPTYISEYFELRNRDQLIWANKVMFKDIRKLLQFLPPQKRKKTVETTKLYAKTPEGKEFGTRYLKEFLNNPTKIGPETFSDWWNFQSVILEELSFEAYKRMAKIVNALSSYIKSAP